jgi:hypothetical protein
MMYSRYIRSTLRNTSLKHLWTVSKEHWKSSLTFLIVVEWASICKNILICSSIETSSVFRIPFYVTSSHSILKVIGIIRNKSKHLWGCPSKISIIIFFPVNALFLILRVPAVVITKNSLYDCVLLMIAYILFLMKNSQSLSLSITYKQWKIW